VPDKTLAMIADEVFRMMAGPGEVQPFTGRFAAFRLEDAYQIVNEIRRRREARGERVCSAGRSASPPVRAVPHGSDC
jgi:hypothetical protein